MVSWKQQYSLFHDFRYEGNQSLFTIQLHVAKRSQSHYKTHTSHIKISINRNGSLPHHCRSPRRIYRFRRYRIPHQHRNPKGSSRRRQQQSLMITKITIKLFEDDVQLGMIWLEWWRHWRVDLRGVALSIGHITRIWSRIIMVEKPKEPSSNCVRWTNFFFHQGRPTYITFQQHAPSTTGVKPLSALYIRSSTPLRHPGLSEREL